MTDELTERLNTALVQAGYTDPRNGNPSVRGMAKALGLNNSRVSRYMYHGSKMQLEAREKIAKALGMTVSELDSEVEGRKVNTYSPPPTANLLDARERTLVNDLINLLADRHKEEGGEHEDSSTSNNDAGGTPAKEDELKRRREERGVTRKHTPYYEREETAASEGTPDETPRDDTNIEDP